jgi:sulfatase maturation enzyme AslB (radical SAM superfamily)
VAHLPLRAGRQGRDDRYTQAREEAGRKADRHSLAGDPLQAEWQDQDEQDREEQDREEEAGEGQEALTPSSRALDSFGVVVTADCNLRCRYCYQDRKQPAFMPWPTLSAAVDLFAGAGRRRARLSFLGGEPLLVFPSIARAVRRAGRRFPEHRPRFALTTNGLLLTEPRIAFLERHKFEVQISCDGGPAAQDLRSPGTFVQLNRLLDRVRTRHRAFFRRRVTLAATVTARAIPFLANSFAYLLGKEPAGIAIGPAMGHRRLTAAGIAELDRQFGRIFKLSLEHYRATGRVPLKLFRKTSPDPKTWADGEFACAAASGNNFVVDVDGQVYPCALLVQSSQRVARPRLARRLAGMALGHVSDLGAVASRLGGLPGASRAAGVFVPQRSKRSSDGRCAACRHAGVCFICPIACAKNPDSNDPKRVPDFQCAFNRVALDYRRRFPRQ